VTGSDIRLATVADLPAVRAIYNHAILHTDATLDTAPKTPADMADWLAEHQGRYAAGVLDIPGAGVVGYATLSAFSRRGGYFPLAEVSTYIDARWHGRGYGTQLTRWLVRQAAERRFSTLVAFITTTNTASARMVSRLGFRHSGVMREAGFKHNRYVDLDIYQLLSVGSGCPPERDVAAAGHP
jgi:L-amino acid N-acyltransferase YncA